MTLAPKAPTSSCLCSSRASPPPRFLARRFGFVFFGRSVGVELGFLLRPIRLAVNNEVIAVAAESVDGALRAHGVCEHREPFIRAAIGSHYHRPGSVPLVENFIRVATLVGVH